MGDAIALGVYNNFLKGCGRLHVVASNGLPPSEAGRPCIATMDFTQCSRVEQGCPIRCGCFALAAAYPWE